MKRCAAIARARGLVIALALLGGACTSMAAAQPRLTDEVYVTADGKRLPVVRWRGEGEARASVIALHGFTEHGAIFYALAPHLAAAGFDVIAYDQRGFGASPGRGTWAGVDTLVSDARALWRMLRDGTNGRPVYLLGHSMGTGVATLAVTGPEAIEPAGMVLLAPAYRSWDTLPWLQSVGLRVAATVMPWARPNQSTGHALADIQVTDDPTISYLQARDAEILREVRFDMTAGVVELMSQARARAGNVPAATLALIAGRDDMVPPRATCGVLSRWARRKRSGPRIAVYPGAYHFIARDRQRATTIGDVVAWLSDPSAALPSGDEHSAAEAHARLCRSRSRPLKQRANRSEGR
jgi:alpha-beta hydrolase superfamily lysophospholipase